MNSKPISIYTWFLKYLAREIKFWTCFFSISILIFSACVACKKSSLKYTKNQVQFHELDISKIKCRWIGDIVACFFTVWPQPIWITVRTWWQIPSQHQSTYLGGPESASIEIPPFRPFFYVNFWNFFFCFTIHKKMNKSCSLNKIFLSLKKKVSSLKKTSFEILWSEVWKGEFQLMLILGLLGMYFDAAVVFLTNS